MTLRELCDMAEGCSRQAWMHTSVILAVVWNRTRWSDKEPARHPDEFNPHAKRESRAEQCVARYGPEILAAAFFGEPVSKFKPKSGS